ncbi:MULTISPECIES: hypothetical protein [Cellulomonas]|nr:MULTISPECIES: hypothetical protein [Cellulomonas]
MITTPQLSGKPGQAPLITQIERVQTINDLHILTPELVDAAREALLIGH